MTKKAKVSMFAVPSVIVAGVVGALSVIPTINSPTIAPNSPLNMLGVVEYMPTIDTTVIPAYTVSGRAIDRKLILDMFQPSEKPYFLNVNHLWFWGDGQSDTGPSPVHSYSTAGNYTVKLQTDISFRGGQVITLSTINDIVVPEPLANPNLVIDISQVPTAVTESQTYNFDVPVTTDIETGIKLSVSGSVGGNPYDVSGMTNINPDFKFVRAGETAVFPVTLFISQGTPPQLNLSFAAHPMALTTTYKLVWSGP